MKRDTIRKSERNRKSIYSGKVETTIGNIFFFVLARLHLHTVQN